MRHPPPFRHMHDNTVLLLHFNEAAGSTTTVDSSGYNQTVTLTGGAATSTAVTPKFGASHLKVLQNVPPDDLCTVSSSDSLTIGQQDFCLDFLFYRAVTSPGWNFVTFSAINWNLYYNSSLETMYFWDGGANRITGTYILSGAQWYHLALTREGESVRMFVEGARTGSVWTDTGITDLTASDMLIGHYPGSTTKSNIYIDELRLVIGDCVSVGDTIEIPTSEY